MSVLIALCLVALLFNKILNRMGRRLTAEYGFDLYGDVRMLIWVLEGIIGVILMLVTLFKFDSDGFFFCLFVTWAVFAAILTLQAKKNLALMGALLASVLQAYVGYFGVLFFFGKVFEEKGKMDAAQPAAAWDYRTHSSNEQFDSKKHWDMEQLSWEARRRGYTDVDAWASAGGYSSADDAYNNGYFDDKMRY